MNGMRMKLCQAGVGAIRFGAAFGATFVLLSAPSSADARVRDNDTSALAMDRVIAPALLSLEVTSPAAENGRPMPDLYTLFGKDISPPIAWSDTPPGTVSYVVIMQDADARGGPATHWLIYNIPGTEKGLRRDIHNRADLKTTGEMQGMNYAGGVGYIGPHPAVGDKPHHYHFQVFALDRMIKVKAKSDLEHVLAAMEGRVLAEGEVVAVYAAPDQTAHGATAKAPKTADKSGDR